MTGQPIVQEKDMEFRITGNTGFQMKIGRIVLSVQFGYGNYCENRYDRKLFPGKPLDGAKSRNAEVALFFDNKDEDSGAEWLTRRVWKMWKGEDLSDDVIGYVTPVELARLVAYLSTNALFWDVDVEEEYNDLKKF